jgi:hypothetical protein
MSAMQIETYERLIKIVTKATKRSEIVAAIEAEIEKLNTLFDLGGGRQAVDFSFKFEEFWKAYPRRDGSNPKKPARTLFITQCRRGADPDQIIAGVRAFACKERRISGTDKVPQAMTFMRQERWRDYLPDSNMPIGDPREARRQAALMQSGASIL